MSNPLSEIRTPGHYRFDTPEDSGGLVYGQALVVQGSAGDSPAQLIFGFGTNNKMAFRCAKSGGYNDLLFVATATPPTEYDLPLAEGFTNLSWSDSSYSKDQMGNVHVHANISIDAAVSSGTQVATLPSGYRPTFAFMTPCLTRVSASTGYEVGYCIVTAGGEVTVGAGSFGSFAQIYLDFSFVAGN